MTLQEMSHNYAASADAIGERIRQLHQRALTAPDPEEVLCLQRRIRELMPLRRQARELAYHTAHYYDRGWARTYKRSSIFDTLMEIFEAFRDFRTDTD